MAVTKMTMFKVAIFKASILFRLIVVLAIFASTTTQAAVLPEDRSDALYHSFDGGGVTIDGPSILVRKQFAEKVSLWGNYYVDMVTSASIDVVTQGSPYSEERTEHSLGADYLHDRTTLSLSHTRSVESDYEAETTAFGVSQDFFGDLTTLTLGYSQGDDIVMRNGDANFQDEASHRRYSLGVTQILTKNWIVAFNAETVIDEGFLNNPYRSVRFLQPNGDVGSQQELYPRTRNSDAFAIKTKYYLPYRAALGLEYRTFSDSWDIQADNYQITYVHPMGENLVIEAKYRAYSQNQASFYSDLFPFQDALSFRARDKELSTFSDTVFGLGISYEVKSRFLSKLDKTTINLFWDHMTFDYENFLDATKSRSVDGEPPQFAVGQEPAYSYDANVIRFFISVWY